MAYKNDTFWQRHAPVYSDEDHLEDLGLFADEAWEWRNWFLSIGLATPLIVPIIYLSYAQGPPSLDQITVFMMISAVYCAGIEWFFAATRVRYRLVADKTWAEDKSVRPRHSDALLRHVVNTPNLYAWLAVPASIKKGLKDGEQHLLLMYVFSFSAVGALFLFMTGKYIPLAILSIIALSLIYIRGYRLRSVVKRSVRTFGDGLEPNDEVHTPLNFGDVESVELCWDNFVCRSYLRLRIGWERIAYYNPSGDPIYLLSLVKHRMPQVERID